MVSLLKRVAEADSDNEYCKTEIAKREAADSDYWLDVRHVGSIEDPLAYQRLAGAEDSARRRARMAAAQCSSVSGLDGEERVAEINRLVEESPAWQDALGECVANWFEAGSSKEEMARLYSVGCRDGGARAASSLLVQAAYEIRLAQEVPAEVGKG